MAAQKLPPIHPGEILLEDFMQPLSLSQNAMAKAINVSPRRINELVNGKRNITADTARRLSRYWGNSAQFWLNLQTRYDLEVLEDKCGAKIDSEIQPRAAANG